MAIAYVGGRTAGFAGTTSTQTVSLGSLTGGDTGDTTPQAGDLVVVSYAVGSTVNRNMTISTPSGGAAYTLMGAELTASDTFDANLRVAYKFMGSTPDTQVTLSGTGSTSDAGRYTIKVFRGVDPSTPLDVAVTTATGVSSRVANPPAIQPVTAGAWIGISGCAACATGGTYTAPSTFVDLLAGSTADTNDAMIGSAHKIDWVSGQFDPAAFGGGGTSTTNDSWCAISYALRPAPTTVTHATSGALSGQGSIVVGAAARTRQHPSSGALTGAGSIIVGVAARLGAPVAHATSGVLVGQGTALTGTAARTRAHAATGILVAQGSSLSGLAARTRAHATSGVLAGGSAMVVGAAARI